MSDLELAPTAKGVIDALGGVTAAAKLLDDPESPCTPQIVWNWGDTGRLPVRRLFPISRALKKVGAKLSHKELCKLFGMLP